MIAKIIVLLFSAFLFQTIFLPVKIQIISLMLILTFTEGGCQKIIIPTEKLKSWLYALRLGPQSIWAINYKSLLKRGNFNYVIKCFFFQECQKKHVLIFQLNVAHILL